jgi:hypothetical protein
VRPEVWDRGGYYDPFVPQRKSVGWSQDLEEVQFIPQRRDDPHQHSEEIEILDGNDNPIPSKAADDMVTTNDNENVTTPNRQRTLPQGYVYTERDNPEITEAQFRENNKEIANEDQSVVFFSDDDSSVRLTSSGPLSDSDGHGNCGRGGVCPDNSDVAQVLFPGEDSEVKSSNFSALSSDEEDDAGRYAGAEPNDEDLE